MVKSIPVKGRWSCFIIIIIIIIIISRGMNGR
jgi:hypothetical protein